MITLFRLLLPVLLVLGGLMLALVREAHAAPADQTLRMPTDAEMAAQRGVMPNVPGSLVAPAAGTAWRPAPSLQDLAEQYERIKRGPGASGQQDSGDRSASGLLIFASLSMPEATLRALITDAQKTRALLVLRGVQDSSLRKTTERIQALMGDARTAWNIDPALFRRFDVRAVPAFVLIDPQRPVLVDCGADRCQGTAHAKVSGDVSVSHALQAIATEDAEFRDTANAYLARLAKRSAPGARSGS